MRGQGVIVKRCGCLEPGTRRRWGRQCPRLSERGHGSWYFHCSMTTFAGRRERVRRGGYASRHAAVAARDALLAGSQAERATQTWTVARWLRYWLTTRVAIRPSTLRSYTEHAERHLIPRLGRIRLGELTSHDATAMFARLAATDTRLGRPPTPTTLHRIRATLRSALNAAVRDGLLRDMSSNEGSVLVVYQRACERRSATSLGACPAVAYQAVTRLRHNSPNGTVRATAWRVKLLTWPTPRICRALANATSMAHRQA